MKAPKRRWRIYQRRAPGPAFEPIEICEDCVAYHANGDLDSFPTDRAARRFARMIERNWPNASIAVGDGDPDTFSWHRCESCDRSHNAGTRYPAVVIPNGWRRPAFAPSRRVASVRA